MRGVVSNYVVGTHLPMTCRQRWAVLVFMMRGFGPLSAFEIDCAHRNLHFCEKFNALVLGGVATFNSWLGREKYSAIS